MSEVENHLSYAIRKILIPSDKCYRYSNVTSTTSYQPHYVVLHSYNITTRTLFDTVEEVVDILLEE